MGEEGEAEPIPLCTVVNRPAPPMGPTPPHVATSRHLSFPPLLPSSVPHCDQATLLPRLLRDGRGVGGTDEVVYYLPSWLI